MRPRTGLTPNLGRQRARSRDFRFWKHYTPRICGCRLLAALFDEDGAPIQGSASRWRLEIINRPEAQDAGQFVKRGVAFVHQGRIAEVGSRQAVPIVALHKIFEAREQGVI